MASVDGTDDSVNASNIDVISIDARVKAKFEEEYEKLPEYKEKLADLVDSLQNDTLKRSVRTSIEKAKVELEKYVENLENKTDLQFYLADTIPLVEKYRQILRTPIKLNYLGKPIKNNKDKETLVNKYIEIASKYVNIDIEKGDPDKIVCKNCGKKKFDTTDTGVSTCKGCFAQQNVIKHVSSYSDIDRVNITTKYTYDRKIHFRDCIKQYQSKQNSTVKPHVYLDLEQDLDRHGLLVGDHNTPKEVRFAKVTKKHISIFLKERGYTKHYENVHLIHHNLTGQPRNDISHLEDKLLDDFDVLTDLYDKVFKGINRKSFINVQHVFYELLCRHRHPCDKNDFVMLKTHDRKFLHDEITETLFNMLNWNHTSLY